MTKNPKTQELTAEVKKTSRKKKKENVTSITKALMLSHLSKGTNQGMATGNDISLGKRPN